MGGNKKMYCEKCGKKTKKGELYCSGCGNELKNNNNSSQIQQDSSTKNTNDMFKSANSQNMIVSLGAKKLISIVLIAFSVLMFLVFAMTKSLGEGSPFLVILIAIDLVVLLCRTKQQKNNGVKRRGGIITLVIALGLIFFVVCIVNFASTENSVNTVKHSNLAITAQATEEQATAIDSILAQCGFEEIGDVNHDEMLDHDGLIGYRMTANNIKNIIVYTTQENQIVTLKYVDKVLCENGIPVDNIKNYTLTDSETNDLMYNTEQIIKSILKSPSTAKFPTILDYSFSKNKEEITVQAYVDSQNSFGAMIRSEFKVTYTPDGKSVTSVIVDGQEYYK